MPIASSACAARSKAGRTRKPPSSCAGTPAIRSSSARAAGAAGAASRREQSSSGWCGSRRAQATWRRTGLRLDPPTEPGETTIRLWSHLPRTVSARRIAGLYRKRWRIEGVFQRLESVLQSGIRSFGHPRGADGLCRGGAGLQAAVGAQAQHRAGASRQRACPRCLDLSARTRHQDGVPGPAAHAAAHAVGSLERCRPDNHRRVPAAIGPPCPVRAREHQQARPQGPQAQGPCRCSRRIGSRFHRPCTRAGAGAKTSKGRPSGDPRRLFATEPGISP